MTPGQRAKGSRSGKTVRGQMAGVFVWAQNTGKSLLQPSRIPAPASCRLMGMVVTLGPQGSAELWQSPCGCLLPRVFTTTRTIFMTMQSKSFSSLSALSCQKFKKKISFLLLFWGCSNSDLELSCFVTLLPPTL